MVEHPNYRQTLATAWQKRSGLLDDGSSVTHSEQIVVPRKTSEFPGALLNEGVNYEKETA